MSSAGELRERYVEHLVRVGVVGGPELADAFRAVPREAFVAGGYHRRDGGRVEAADESFLPGVYRDDVLVTKLDDGVPVSSSSQPSLMALMLAALRVRAGMRVLEIGAGTGYNAALLAALGATVTSVDVQPDVVERARSALRRAGVGAAEVLVGDGYLGHPDGAPYHRVIVTVGISGLSPRWLDQLTADGLVVAPVAHAGNHPVLAARRAADGGVAARAVCPAGFMVAAGPLSAAHAWAHPVPRRGLLPPAAVRRAPRWQPSLSMLDYLDLWFAAGAWHRRVTHAPVAGLDHGGCVLIDPDGDGAAAVLPDGAVHGSGAGAERCVAEAVALVDRWEATGRPGIAAWRAELAPAGDPDQPIWAPRRWRLDDEP